MKRNTGLVSLAWFVVASAVGCADPDSTESIAQADGAIMPGQSAGGAGGASGVGGGSKGVKVCHIPSGDPKKAHTLVVGAASVQAHLDHGDVLGDCDDDDGCSPGAEEADDAAANKKGGKSGGVKKVAICHVPPGNPANAHTIVVGEPSVQAHLAHGDSLGACKAPPVDCSSSASTGSGGSTTSTGSGGEGTSSSTGSGDTSTSSSGSGGEGTSTGSGGAGGSSASSGVVFFFTSVGSGEFLTTVGSGGFLTTSSSATGGSDSSSTATGGGEGCSPDLQTCGSPGDALCPDGYECLKGCCVVKSL